MTSDMLFSITVPGSTANLGPGFDSIGLAVDRYLRLDVSQADDGWKFIPMSEEVAGIPSGKDNLIYEVAASLAADYDKELPPCNIHMYSEIPLSRGMGSSAAAIVAAIELADVLLDLNMTIEEKARRASLVEGHPDNVTASLYGGLVIGTHNEEETEVIFGGYPEIEMVAVIPDYELKTKDSRGLLPGEFSYGDAVKASSISNVLVAALLKNRWDVAGKMMMKDLFHQPYRGKVVPELEKGLAIASQLDVYGVSLSGAGPIVLFHAPVGEGQRVKEELDSHFPGYDIQVLKVDKNGVTCRSGQAVSEADSLK